MRIFLSYCWVDRNVAEIIDTHFSKKKYTVIRDVRDLGYKENIKEYMRKIRYTDYAILIVSDSFLKSSNCMFEVLELLESTEYEKRIVPILVNAANIFSPEGRLEYFNFWNNRLSELKALARNEKSEFEGSSIKNEIEDCRRVMGSVDDFLSHLNKHFHPSFQELRKENFRSINKYLSPIEPKVFSRTHLFGHPIGLFIISLMVFGDRFSYYGLRGILVLALILPIAEGGFGMQDLDALKIIFSFYTGMYFFCILGGLLGDFVLDRKRTQLLGMFVLTTGFFFMSQSSSFIHFGLFVIALGSGLVKPNSVALISDLYHDHDYLRDDGFSIYYTLVNAGAYFSLIIVTYIFSEYGHEIGFLVAGLGMLASLGIYFIGSKHIAEGINSKVKLEYRIGLGSRMKFKSSKILVVALVLTALFWLSFELWGSLMFVSEEFLINSMEFFYYQFALIIVFGIPLSYLISRKFRKVSHHLYLSKIAVGLVLSLIATSILAVGGSDFNMTLILAFLAISTLSELFFQPTIIAYITWIAPKRFLATAVSGMFFSLFLTWQLNKLFSTWGLTDGTVVALLYSIQFFLLGLVAYVLWSGRRKNWELFESTL